MRSAGAAAAVLAVLSTITAAVAGAVVRHHVHATDYYLLSSHNVGSALCLACHQ